MLLLVALLLVVNDLHQGDKCKISKGHLLSLPRIPEILKPISQIKRQALFPRPV